MTTPARWLIRGQDRNHLRPRIYDEQSGQPVGLASRGIAALVVHEHNALIQLLEVAERASVEHKADPYYAEVVTFCRAALGIAPSGSELAT